MSELIEHDDQQVATLPPQVTNPLDLPTRQFKQALTRRKANREALMEWVKEALVAGIDYMQVYSKKKGEWSKPFMTKAGAEKVLGMLGVTPTFPTLPELEAMIQKGECPAIIGVRCDLINTNGDVIGMGAGARSLTQDYGDVNKAIKMCLKSAMIDATLRLGGLSELFTQDEESAEEPPEIEMPISAEQYAALQKLLKDYDLPEEPVAKYFGVESLSLLPAKSLVRCEKAIHKAGQKKEATDDRAQS